MSIYLSVSPEPRRLAERCVEVLEALGTQAIQRDGRFVVSLAGGTTPEDVYRLWARSTVTDWERTVLLFGDERRVPPEHPDSNFRMVQETLLDELAAHPQVLRMEGERPDGPEAARRYEAQLREVLGADGRIHVALLGMGDDGHTASLFPGSPALRDGDDLCLATESPEGAGRLTLTIPLLRRSHKLMFLVAGSAKADIVQQVVEGPLDPERLPSQFFVRDDRLNVNLLLDEPAAAKLSRQA